MLTGVYNNYKISQLLKTNNNIIILCFNCYFYYFHLYVNCDSLYVIEVFSP